MTTKTLPSSVSSFWWRDPKPEVEAAVRKALAKPPKPPTTRQLNALPENVRAAYEGIDQATGAYGARDAFVITVPLPGGKKGRVVRGDDYNGRATLKIYGADDEPVTRATARVKKNGGLTDLDW